MQVETPWPMKRLSWPGAIVVLGSTTLSWMTGSPVVPPAGQPGASMGSHPSAAGAPATAASIDAMRLHDWRPRQPAPGRSNRDIFAFKRRAVPPPAPSSAPSIAAAVPQAPPVLFRLIGFAEDAGPEGVIRTAIISGQGQLYLVKEGETVGSIYRVGKMAPDSVELLDSTGGPMLQLALR